MEGCLGWEQADQPPASLGSLTDLGVSVVQRQMTEQGLGSEFCGFKACLGSENKHQAHDFAHS